MPGPDPCLNIEASVLNRVRACAKEISTSGRK
jgi:hypothetical protein